MSPQSCAQASRLRRFAAIAAIIAGVLALAVGPIRVAAAAPAPASAPVEAAVPVMIVLDASGSMNQTDAPGPRIDAAKSAVTDLLGTLPAGTQVGLMAYGTGTGSTDAEKTVGCQDIKTLSPVGSLDVPALIAQVNAVTASGYTPIGNVLRTAADGLPNEGPRSIVLVSDGEDTCAPPAPCDVARDLDQQGIDLTVHTVGFKVDPTARDQLRWAPHGAVTGPGGRDDQGTGPNAGGSNPRGYGSSSRGVVRLVKDENGELGLGQ